MLQPHCFDKEVAGVHGVTFSVWRSLSGKLAPGFCRHSTLNGVAEIQPNFSYL
jgi:hypothetical protein